MGLSQLAVVLLICVGSCIAACPRPCVCEKNFYGDFIVNCSRRNLHRIPSFENVSGVDVLDLSYNFLRTFSSVTLMGNRPRIIHLQENMIQHLDDNAFAGLGGALTSLTVQLRVIPTKALSVLHNLKSLKIRVSQRTIPQSAFPYLPKLRNLELHAFEPATIDDKAFDEIKDYLHLMDLELSSSTTPNRIPLAVKTLRELKTLKLMNSNLQTIPDNAFNGMNRLKNLYLDGNKFSNSNSFSLRSFAGIEKSLEHLSLYNASLEQIPVAELANLKQLVTLDLGHNSIEEIKAGAFSGLDSLVELKLGQSSPLMKISAYSFSGLEDTLMTLSMAESGLKKIPRDEIKRLQKLNILYLDKNDITLIPADATKDLNVLYYNLSFNGISAISVDAFEGNRTHDRLISLDLRKNDLRRINFIGDKCTFRSIDLRENPLNCDTFQSDYLESPDIRAECKNPGSESISYVRSGWPHPNFTKICPIKPHTPMIGESIQMTQNNCWSFITVITYLYISVCAD